MQFYTLQRNVYGRYSFPRPRPGQFKLCFEAVGFVSSCRDDLITVSERTAATIVSQITPVFPFLSGQLSREDLLQCTDNAGQSSGALNESCSVLLVDKSGATVTSAFPVNMRGQYVISQVPQDHSYFVRVLCEGPWSARSFSGSRPMVSAMGQTAYLPVQFSDVTKAAGITFVHFKGSNGSSIILEEIAPRRCHQS